MSKGTVLALVGGAAALAVVAFFWTSDSSSFDQGDRRVTSRRALDDRDGDASAPRRADARARSESRHNAPRAHERMEGDESGAARRRVPPPVSDGQNPGAAPRAGSAQSSGQMAGSRREPGGGIARAPVNREEDGSRERPDLPEATGLNPAQDVDDEAVEPPAEPMREVAFEGGDRLFDTGVPMEVPGAGRISPDGGMVSFWIQPEWSHNKEDSADLMRLGESGLQILKEGSFIRFQYSDAAGNEQGGDADIGEWQDGEWHHVVASWTGEAMSLYVDGGQAFANAGITRPPAQSDPRLFVGSAFPEGQGIALARMSHLTVINRTASGEEVKKVFEAGGPVKK